MHRSTIPPSCTAAVVQINNGYLQQLRRRCRRPHCIIQSECSSPPRPLGPRGKDKLSPWFKPAGQRLNAETSSTLPWPRATFCWQRKMEESERTSERRRRGTVWLNAQAIHRASRGATRPRPDPAKSHVTWTTPQSQSVCSAWLAWLLRGVGDVARGDGREELSGEREQHVHK